MSEELFFFTMGALFVYGKSMSARLWHVVSLIVLYMFIYSLITRKTSKDHYSNVKIFKPGEIGAGATFLLCEHLFVKRRSSILYLVVEKVFVVAMLCGYFLSLYSVFERCRKWREEKAFISTGVYQYVRHPFYLGLLTFAIGACVYLTSYVSAVFIMIYMFTKIRERIVDEEQLVAKSSTLYTEYQKKVPSGFFI